MIQTHKEKYVKITSVNYKRICVKPGCSNTAQAAFTYVYSDSTIVIGPLSPMADPDVYDLCSNHAKTFVAPRGWQVIRLQSQVDNNEMDEEKLKYLAESIIIASKKPIQLPKYSPPNIKNSSNKINNITKIDR